MSLSILFCSKCGSHEIDVASWRNENTCVIRCCECRSELSVTGPTIGRAMFDDRQAEFRLIADAVSDIAEWRVGKDELRMQPAAAERVMENLKAAGYGPAAE